MSDDNIVNLLDLCYKFGINQDFIKEINFLSENGLNNFSLEDLRELTESNFLFLVNANEEERNKLANFFKILKQKLYQMDYDNYLQSSFKGSDQIKFPIKIPNEIISIIDHLVYRKYSYYEILLLNFDEEIQNFNLLPEIKNKLRNFFSECFNKLFITEPSRENFMELLKVKSNRKRFEKILDYFRNNPFKKDVEELKIDDFPEYLRCDTVILNDFIKNLLISSFWRFSQSCGREGKNFIITLLDYDLYLKFRPLLDYFNSVNLNLELLRMPEIIDIFDELNKNFPDLLKDLKNSLMLNKRFLIFSSTDQFSKDIMRTLIKNSISFNDILFFRDKGIFEEFVFTLYIKSYGNSDKINLVINLLKQDNNREISHIHIFYEKVFSLIKNLDAKNINFFEINPQVLNLILEEKISFKNLGSYKIEELSKIFEENHLYNYEDCFLKLKNSMSTANKFFLNIVLKTKRDIHFDIKFLKHFNHVSIKELIHCYNLDQLITKFKELNVEEKLTDIQYNSILEELKKINLKDYHTDYFEDFKKNIFCQFRSKQEFEKDIIELKNKGDYDNLKIQLDYFFKNYDFYAENFIIEYFKDDELTINFDEIYTKDKLNVFEKILEINFYRKSKSFLNVSTHYVRFDDFVIAKLIGRDSRYITIFIEKLKQIFPYLFRKTLIPVTRELLENVLIDERYIKIFSLGILNNNTTVDLKDLQDLMTDIFENRNDLFSKIFDNFASFRNYYSILDVFHKKNPDNGFESIIKSFRDRLTYIIEENESRYITETENVFNQSENGFNNINISIGLQQYESIHIPIEENGFAKFSNMYDNEIRHSYLNYKNSKANLIPINASYCQNQGAFCATYKEIEKKLFEEEMAKSEYIKNEEEENLNNSVNFHTFRNIDKSIYIDHNEIELINSGNNSINNSQIISPTPVNDYLNDDAIHKNVSKPYLFDLKINDSKNNNINSNSNPFDLSNDAVILRINKNQLSKTDDIFNSKRIIIVEKSFRNFNKLQTMIEENKINSELDVEDQYKREVNILLENSSEKKKEKMNEIFVKIKTIESQDIIDEKEFKKLNSVIMKKFSKQIFEISFGLLKIISKYFKNFSGKMPYCLYNLVNHDCKQAKELFEFYKIFKFNESKIEDNDMIVHLKEKIEEIFVSNVEIINIIFGEVKNLKNKIKNPITKLQTEFRTLENILSEKEIGNGLKLRSFTKIVYNTETTTIRNNIIENFKQNRPIIDLLEALFFDCLKRREDISHHLHLIRREIKDFPITNNNLLNYIINNSDISLKIALLKIASKLMPIPFLSSLNNNPNLYHFNNSGLISEDNNNNTLNENYEFNLELFFLLKKNSANILSFCFSNEGKYPKGKSFLLNYMFNTSFETGELFSKRGIMEFQMINACEKKNYNIVDYHGCANENLINYISHFFNHFIIHLKKEEKEIINENLLKLENQIRNKFGDKFKIIYILHNSNQENEIKVDIYEERKIFNIHISNIMNMKEEKLKEFNDKIRKIIDDDYLSIVNVPDEFIKLCENLFSDVRDLEENRDKLNNIINYLENHEGDLIDLKIFPFNKTFNDFCSQKRNLCKKRIKENDSNLENLENLMNIYKSQNSTRFIEFFHSLYKDSYFLANLINFSEYLKQLTEEKTLNLKYEKDKEKIFNNSLSIEHCVRELYHISRILHKSSPETNYFKEFSLRLISNSLPFEIIDGDNSHFISNFYEELLDSSDYQETLVISIIGPQSSGKSFLLNRIFGTQFESSSGRCTKGIYGCLIDVNQHPKYKKILILDTEGIQSAERNDDEFDSKLMTFCLCRSSIIIVCNKQEINQNTKVNMKNCLRIINELKEAKLKDPHIFFVLNNLTDINRNRLWEPIGELLNDLGNSNISEENMITLPHAYSTQMFGSDNGKKLFSYECERFKNLVLNLNVKSCELRGWFSESNRLWENYDRLRIIMFTHHTLEELNRNLTTDIEEKERNFTEEILKIKFELFYDPKTKITLENYNSVVNQGERQLKISIEKIKDQYLEKFDTQFSRLKDSHEYRSKIFTKKRDNLETILYHILLERVREFGNLIVNLRNENTTFRSETIDNKIKEIAKTSVLPMDKDEANENFNKIWDDWKKKLEEKINKSEIETVSFNLIYNNYNSITHHILHDNIFFEEIKNALNENRKEEFVGKIKNFIKKKEIQNILNFRENHIIDKKKFQQKIKSEYFSVDENLFVEDKIDIYYEIDLENGLKSHFIKQLLSEINEELIYKNRRKIDNFKDTKNKLIMRKIIIPLEEDCKNLGFIFNFSEVTKKELLDFIFINEVNNPDVEDILKTHLRVAIEEKIKNKININYISEFFDHTKLFKRIIVNNGTPVYSNLPLFKYKENLNYKINKEITNQYVNKYLEWLNSDNDFVTELVKFEAKNYFNKFIRFDNIIDRVISFTFNYFFKDNLNSNILNYFECTEKIILSIRERSDISDMMNLFSNHTNEKLKNLSEDVKSLIYELDKNLKNYGLEVSETGRKLFHTLAMILYANIYSLLEAHRSNEPFRISENEKEKLRQYFLTVLTDDHERNDIDLLNAEFIANQISKISQIKYYNHAKSVYLDRVNSKKEDYNPLLSMENIDKKLKVTDNTQEILNCILNPIQYLVNDFEIKWEKMNRIIINDIKIEYLDSIRNTYDPLIDYFFRFNLLLKENFDVLSNLIIDIESETDDHLRHIKNSGYVISAYLCSIINDGSYSSKELNYENMQYKFRDRELPNYKKIFIEEDIKIKLIECIENKSIRNIVRFLDNLNSALRNSKQNLEDNSPNYNILDINGRKNDFIKTFIGCSEVCKICGRKCDQTHDANKEKHKCSSGHRFKCFGGSKIRILNSPSFISCDEMKNDDVVYYQNNLMKWFDFKILYPDWDFSIEGALGIEENKNKNIEIWNKIGKNVCDYYTNNNNKMIFSEYNELKSNKNSKTNFIFLLDDSGSMLNTDVKISNNEIFIKRWNSLERAFTGAMEFITNLEELKEKIKITTILHSSDSRVMFEERTPDVNLVKEFKPIFLRTNFENAFSCAYEKILNTKDKYDKFVIIFMSDGEGEYPGEIINTINFDQINVFEKLKFRIILFGNDEKGKIINQKIATNIPGATFSNVFTVEGLESKFIEEIYNNQFA